jgi:transposase-like protein
MLADGVDAFRDLRRWRNFVLSLRDRGLAGVEFLVLDDHAGLRRGAARDPA